MWRGDENGHCCSRMGIEPTYLAFWVSVLTITPSRLPDVTTLSTATGLSGSLSEKDRAGY